MADAFSASAPTGDKSKRLRAHRERAVGQAIIAQPYQVNLACCQTHNHSNSRCCCMSSGCAICTYFFLSYMCRMLAACVCTFWPLVVSLLTLLAPAAPIRHIVIRNGWSNDVSHSCQLITLIKTIRVSRIRIYKVMSGPSKQVYCGLIANCPELVTWETSFCNAVAQKACSSPLYW